MAINLEIDKLDMEILSLLMKDAKMPYTEIAKQLTISGGTVHVRMKKLEEMGIVKGSHLEIDAGALGYDLCAFVGVFLERGSLYNEIVEELLEVDEITEIHYTTGSYSIFLKIVCRNTRQLRTILNDKIQAIDGIQRTESFISLEESIKRAIKLNTSEWEK